MFGFAHTVDLTKPYKVRNEQKGDVIASFDTLIRAMDFCEIRYKVKTNSYYISTPDYKTWRLVSGGFDYSWKQLKE